MLNIASERKRLGYRQKDLANKLGISERTVSRWEQGVLFPTSDYLVSMHEVFGCSTDYLLGLTDERKPVA